MTRFRTPLQLIRNRRLAILHFIALIALLPVPGQASSQALTWHNLSSLRVEGKAWEATKHPYDRLPARAEGVVRPDVWGLSHDSAGLYYRFTTDSDVLRARWILRRADQIALPHMPSTGVSGLDLYVRDGGQWHWMGVGIPGSTTLNEATLAEGLTREKREYLLYLPLYNGVDSIELGLLAGATLEPAPDRYAGYKPILYYGTSIVQGGCASRPGMAHAAILGRMLDWPVINLGFSGNGKSEPEMARLLAELDPSVYILDSLPNLSVAEAAERVEPFVRVIRAAHPGTPIVLVENVPYADARYKQARRSKVEDIDALLETLFEKMRAGGDTAVYYVRAGVLLGSDGEATVDGTHPTDLGFLRMAEGIAPVLKAVLHLPPNNVSRSR